MSGLKEKAFNISTQPDKPLYVVRLEDAQKEIDELKQKLQQLFEEIPSCINCEYCLGDWEGCSHCSLSEQQHIDSTRCLKDKFLNALPKKFERLLKEEREAKHE